MLPRASSLTRVLLPPLSRVSRRLLYLRCPPGWSCSWVVRADNPALTCVPLTQARIAAIDNYYGPSVTCQASCLCMPGLVVPCRTSRMYRRRIYRMYRLACCVYAYVPRVVVCSRACRVRACKGTHLPSKHIKRPL
jgi:hypothetical protein